MRKSATYARGGENREDLSKTQEGRPLFARKQTSGGVNASWEKFFSQAKKEIRVEIWEPNSSQKNPLWQQETNKETGRSEWVLKKKRKSGKKQAEPIYWRRPDLKFRGFGEVTQIGQMDNRVLLRLIEGDNPKFYSGDINRTSKGIKLFWCYIATHFAAPSEENDKPRKTVHEESLGFSSKSLRGPDGEETPEWVWWSECSFGDWEKFDRNAYRSSQERSDSKIPPPHKIPAWYRPIRAIIVPNAEIPPSQVAMLRTLREKEAMKNDASLLTTPNFYTKEYSKKQGLDELIDITMQKAGFHANQQLLSNRRAAQLLDDLKDGQDCVLVTERDLLTGMPEVFETHFVTREKAEKFLPFSRERKENEWKHRLWARDAALGEQQDCLRAEEAAGRKFLWKALDRREFERTGLWPVSEEAGEWLTGTPGVRWLQVKGDRRRDPDLDDAEADFQGLTEGKEVVYSSSGDGYSTSSLGTKQSGKKLKNKLKAKDDTETKEGGTKDPNATIAATDGIAAPGTSSVADASTSTQEARKKNVVAALGFEDSDDETPTYSTEGEKTRARREKEYYLLERRRTQFNWIGMWGTSAHASRGNWCPESWDANEYRQNLLRRNAQKHKQMMLGVEKIMKEHK